MHIAAEIRQFAQSHVAPNALWYLVFYFTVSIPVPEDTIKQTRRRKN